MGHIVESKWWYHTRSFRWSSFPVYGQFSSVIHDRWHSIAVCQVAGEGRLSSAMSKYSNDIIFCEKWSFLNEKESENAQKVTFHWLVRWLIERLDINKTKKKKFKRQLKCSSIPCLLLVVPSVNKSVSISSIAQNVLLGVKLCVSCASVGCALNNCRSSFRVCFLSTKIVFFFLSPFLRAIHISNTVFLAGAKCRIFLQRSIHSTLIFCRRPMLCISLLSQMVCR